MSSLLDPKSVAVVGASDNLEKIGGIIYNNLQSFVGKVYPVNPTHSTINGSPCYPTVEDINQKIDLAIIAVPAELVPKVLRSTKNAKNIIIISAGFSEFGNEGLEKEILRIAKGNKQKIIGPNCVGLQLPYLNFNGTFIQKTAKEGNIAFISQSGGFCGAALGWADKENIGFSAFISIGNMLDLDFADLIEMLNEDKKTKAIAMYIEGLKDGRKFLEIAKSSKKPLIVYKVGKSEEGKKAAMTHTGSLAGSYKVYQGVFKQAKIIEAESTSELFDLIKGISLINKKKELIILSNSGGPAVSAADYAVNLKELSPNTVRNLTALLPWKWNKSNPIDLSGNANSEIYLESMKILSKENANLLAILIPTSMIDSAEIAQEIPDNSIACFMSGSLVEEGVKILKEEKIACFETPEQAIKVLNKIF